jgi:putative phosphoribosyl transferase
MDNNTVFYDRHDAGKKLAVVLVKYKGADLIILGMPRGGVVVAAEVAKFLLAPLDIIVVRKIGAPNQPEYAIGAIAEGGILVQNQETVGYYDFNSAAIKKIVAKEQQEMLRRIKKYRGNKAALDLAGKTVIIVDDGIATGQSALAAILAVRKKNPTRVILATGVCAFDSCKMLKASVDDLICLNQPNNFNAVGQWYKNFSATTDDEVSALLNS